MGAEFIPFSQQASLDDGRRLYLRAIHPGDRERLREELFLKLSLKSLRNRFFAIKRDLTPDELRFFCEVDFVRHVAIVAELECDGHRRLVGVARFVRPEAEAKEAEFAITVVDAFQRHGIGGRLFAHLVTSARELDIERLDGTLLAQNNGMTGLIRQTRLPSISSRDNGVVSVSIHIR